jgi:hypothetical protein
MSPCAISQMPDRCRLAGCSRCYCSFYSSVPSPSLAASSPPLAASSPPLTAAICFSWQPKRVQEGRREQRGEEDKSTGGSAVKRTQVQKVAVAPAIPAAPSAAPCAQTPHTKRVGRRWAGGGSRAVRCPCLLVSSLPRAISEMKQPHGEKRGNSPQGISSLPAYLKQ